MGLLNNNIDPLGNAVKDFFITECNVDIIVESNIADKYIIPSSYFFRTYRNMPSLERIALSECKGKVLDIGAGAGCHSLHLQRSGFEVTALEISELCCEVMSKRGARSALPSVPSKTGRMGFHPL